MNDTQSGILYGTPIPSLGLRQDPKLPKCPVWEEELKKRQQQVPKVFWCERNIRKWKKEETGEVPEERKRKSI